MVEQEKSITETKSCFFYFTQKQEYFKLYCTPTKEDLPEAAQLSTELRVPVGPSACNS
jgi:hypothetical protein